MQRTTFNATLVTLGICGVIALILFLILPMIKPGPPAADSATATAPTAAPETISIEAAPTSLLATFLADRTPTSTPWDSVQPTALPLCTAGAWSPECATTTLDPSGSASPMPVPSATPFPTYAVPTPVPIPHLTGGQTVPINKLHMLDTLAGWAIGSVRNGSADHILTTSDGGTTWRDVTPPYLIITDEYYFFATTFFADATSAWVAYSPSTFRLPDHFSGTWHTRDGGDTWTPSKSSAPDWVTGLYFLDSQTGWMLGKHFEGMAMDVYDFLIIEDGGQNWKEIAADSGGFKRSVVFLDTRIGWSAGGGELLNTNDGGQTWQPRVLPPPAEAPGLFTDPGYCDCDITSPTFLPGAAGARFGTLTVECCFDRDTKQHWLYTTTNGGQTWRSYLLPMPDGKIEFVNPTVGWFLGTDNLSSHTSLLYRTQDGGRTWTLVKEFAPDSQSDEVDFADEYAGWVVVYSGAAKRMVLWHTTDGGRTWSELEPHIGP